MSRLFQRQITFTAALFLITLILVPAGYAATEGHNGYDVAKTGPTLPLVSLGRSNCPPANGQDGSDTAAVSLGWSNCPPANGQDGSDTAAVSLGWPNCPAANGQDGSDAAAVSLGWPNCPAANGQDGSDAAANPWMAEPPCRQRPRRVRRCRRIPGWPNRPPANGQDGSDAAALSLGRDHLRTWTVWAAQIGENRIEGLDASRCASAGTTTTLPPYNSN